MSKKFSFTKVSMSYMSYENGTLIQKIKFWIQFPIAYLKFQRCVMFEKDLHEVRK